MNRIDELSNKTKVTHHSQVSFSSFLIQHLRQLKEKKKPISLSLILDR